MANKPTEEKPKVEEPKEMGTPGNAPLDSAVDPKLNEGPATPQVDAKEESDKQAEEIRYLTEQLEKEKAKNKFKPDDMPIPADQKGLPEGLQDSEIKTSIRKMKDIISERMQQMKDMATMELLLGTGVGMKNRLESIKEMSQAKHLKIRGKWTTIAPKMHISSLEGKKISNDEFQISFGVFDVNEKGDKRLYTQYADFVLHDGSQIRRATSAEYRVVYEVIETIKTSKPIVREIVPAPGATTEEK